MAYIIADNVSVELPIFEAQHRSLKNSLLGAAGAGRLSFSKGHVIVQALRNITLTANHGDRIALIGRNGAGKSTLLRTLAGLTEPNSGSVKSEGTIATLFNVGSFLDPNATGYENIQHAGRLLGLSAAAINDLTPEIERFTELGQYLALPVRTYSAGMSVRLAFSIATAIEPDILLLDEAITAGDSHFVSKAAQRAEELYQRTSIMIVASHDTSILRRMCNKALFLESGRIVASGDVESVIKAYERHGATAVVLGGSDEGEKRVITHVNGDAEGAAHAVLDAASETGWKAHNSRNSWIGIDLSDPKLDPRPNVSSVIVRHCVDDDAMAPGLQVETSDDFFVSDIRAAGSIVPKASDERACCIVNSVEKGAHWRIRPNFEAETGVWSVHELTFHSHAPKAIADPESETKNPQSVLREDADAWISESFLNVHEPTDRWIGLDYGSNVRVMPSSLLLKQWGEQSESTCVRVVRVDCSDDGFDQDIRTVAEISLNEPINELQRLHFPKGHGQEASCWRIVAVNPTESGYWGVERLAFETDVPETCTHVVNAEDREA